MTQNEDALEAAWRAVHELLPMADCDEAKEIAKAAISAWTGDVLPETGVCCSCGDKGESNEETPCPKRHDRIHCVHWWDVPEKEVAYGPSASD